MEIEEVKKRLLEIEQRIDDEVIVEFAEVVNNDRKLIVYLTSIFRKNCKKNKIWKSKKFLITLKNIKYGIDYTSFRSKGGKDGIFRLDRDHRPKNEMQRKIFDQFIDKMNSGFKMIVDELELSGQDINAVRVVSHHMRLLGIHQDLGEKDILVLINCDDTK